MKPPFELHTSTRLRIPRPAVMAAVIAATAIVVTAGIIAVKTQRAK